MIDLFYITFPVSGVTTWIFIPPLVAFAVSFFTSMGGVSGAFVLLPFQMSILNHRAPSVSGTNQLFNINAIPSGVLRYIKEKRMVWLLTWSVIMGTFVTSIAGVITYQVLASFYSGMSVAPDWYPGLLFGTGGFAGMYLGPRCQKHVPANAIKMILCVCVLFVASKYIYDFIG